MSMSNRTIKELFEQLGLSSEKIHIERFIDRHQMKQGSVLEDGIFWTADQKSFLIEAKAEDSDWCEVVDRLAALLIRVK